MKKMMRFSMLSLALALALGAASASLSLADDAAAKTGTISGKVVDGDGKAVKGASVFAYAPKPAGDPKPQAAEGDAPKRERPKPLAEATTGEDGTFKLDKVPAGKVMVVARLQGVGRAHPVQAEVVADQDTKIDDIKLMPMQRKGGGGGGGAEVPK